MTTYLALKQIVDYLEGTDNSFKALFGILYLTNDINLSQQFYGSQYLSEAVGIDKLPQYGDLLIMLDKLGSNSLEVNLLPNGKISLKNINQDYLQPNFNNKIPFNINVNEYPTIAAGVKLISNIINDIKHQVAIKNSESQNISDNFNFQDVNPKIINDIEVEGYSVVENFFNQDTLKKLQSITNKIAKNERDTKNAYFYGKNGKNQRLYNLLSKHQIFRDVLDSVWLEKLLDIIFDRDTFHEKYGLSSMAAHIIPPGGEAQPIHIDNAVPEPIPPWAIRFVIVVPLTDFTKENGPTSVVPKSHKLYRKPTPDDDSIKSEVSITAKAGSLIIWDGNLWHRSTENISNKDRSALIISYAASFFKEVCGEEEYLVVVPERLKNKVSPRIQSLIGMNRGIKKSASYIPDYD
jgi:ectoine hydroxylase-related dioxygenase (phytanoyl-CoA dioxygenase family)|tara:strand:- start:385 stop:1605 length:1221 start_codon:yes stop_codon:yes gene_type:complete